MQSFIPVIYFLSITATLVFITKESFGKNLILSILVSSFILFFSQFIFQTFNIGFILLIIFSILWIPLILFNLKTEKFEMFKKQYIGNGLVYYLIFNIFIIIYDYNRTFSFWDEFSHWGVMIKEMLRIDKFYTISTSTLMAHKDYPPIVQMYELLWVKLARHYYETILIRSIHFLEFSFFIIAIEKINVENKLIRNILYIFIPSFFLIITSLFDQHGIVNCIYVDYLMAILSAFILYYITQEKNILNNFNFFILILLNSFLVLTKQMGLPLYLMICFYITFSIVLRKKRIIIKEKFNYFKYNYKKIINLLILLVIPFIFYFSWNIYVKSFKIDKQFVVSDIKINKLIDIHNGTYGEDYQRAAFNNYMIAIQSRNLTTNNLQLCFMQLALISLFLLAYSLKKYKSDKNLKILLMITVLIGTIGYAFVMLNLYVFSFGPIEGPGIASFDRYMSTYILLILYLATLIFISNENIEKSTKKFILLFLLVYSISSPNKLYNIRPSLYKHQINFYEENAEIIKKYAKDYDKIFIIAQDTVGDYQYYLKYYVGAVTTNLHNFSFNTGEDINYKEYFEENYLKDIEKFDYLYLARITDDFIEKYGFIFEDENIKERNIYKIEKENNNIILKKLN